MRQEVRMMKKTLEVDAKRKKKMHLIKPTIEKLTSDDLWFEKVPVFYYNKNVTKVSKESGNKRSMMFPLHDLNIFCSFASKVGTEATFTVKWFEGYTHIEASILSVYIQSNKETNEVVFYVLYNYAEGGKACKSEKIAKVNFEFDDHEVVKMGTNTDMDESFKSVGYVLLENICEYLTKKEDGRIDTDFETFFVDYSEITEKEEVENFNMDNVLNLLSGAANDINEEELLTVKYL